MKKRDKMPSKYTPGKHFLQIPGPSNVPDRILRAMDFPTIDHRGQDFFDLSKKCLSGMKKIFKTNSHVIIIPRPVLVLGKLPLQILCPREILCLW